MFDYIILGFQTALQPTNMLYCFTGVVLGTLIGVLPGLGPVATISILLPITFKMPAVGAIIMLAGIYYGAQYGGSTTSILLNIPGRRPRLLPASMAIRWPDRGEPEPHWACPH